MEHNHMLARPPHAGETDGGWDKHTHRTKHEEQASSDFPPFPNHNPIHLASSYPPPSYSQAHDVDTLSFPAVPTTELAPIQPYGDHDNAANNTLPSLASLTESQRQRYTPPQPSESSCSPPPPGANNWPSLNPLTAFYTPSHAQPANAPQRMDVDAASNNVLSAASPDRFYEGRASSINLDDPDVRLAAEALGDLRADFVSSPPNQHTPLPAGSPSSLTSQATAPEPLFSLLTTSHPLLATTIEGATSAYNNSKNFSPTFKTSAEYVEGYLGPIATTVGSVGRVTGVEGGVRWFLGAGRRRQPSASDLEAGAAGSPKRRKVDSFSRDMALGGTTDKPTMDLYGFTRDRRTSMSTVDTLPAYDELRSPAYSEAIDARSRGGSRSDSSTPAAWQHRLILSTSGLSIAMRVESLRSLKYCLRWLRWANEHIANVIAALNSTLDQYESCSNGPESRDTAGSHTSDHAMAGTTPEPPVTSAGTSKQDRGELAARIVALKGDVLKTLQSVIETVSKYAGGALPENARVLVHRHLTSLPQRFWLATKQDVSALQHDSGEQEKEVREGAQRALVLAKEGLDMMAQVSGVLDGTIVSAEDWCERLGKANGEDQEPPVTESTANESAPRPLTDVNTDEDTRMS